MKKSYESYQLMSRKVIYKFNFYSYFFEISLLYWEFLILHGKIFKELLLGVKTENGCILSPSLFILF